MPSIFLDDWDSIEPGEIFFFTCGEYEHKLFFIATANKDLKLKYIDEVKAYSDKTYKEQKLFNPDIWFSVYSEMIPIGLMIVRGDVTITFCKKELNTNYNSRIEGLNYDLSKHVYDAVEFVKQYMK